MAKGGRRHKKEKETGQEVRERDRKKERGEEEEEGAG